MGVDFHRRGLEPRTRPAGRVRFEPPGAAERLQVVDVLLRDGAGVAVAGGNPPRVRPVV